MYEAFFGMEHTPFVRDVPPEKLYESKEFKTYFSLENLNYTQLKSAYVYSTWQNEKSFTIALI